MIFLFNGAINGYVGWGFLLHKCSCLNISHFLLYSNFKRNDGQESLKFNG